MKTITLRDIPPDIAQVIEDRARRLGVSLSQAVIGMLSEPALTGCRTDRTDLDHLFGLWSNEEAIAFDGALADQRQIDEGLWR